MLNKPIRVGVVGGGIGRTHLASYKALGDQVEIVALCDLDEARLKELGDTYNIPLRYTDAHALFNSGEIDVVSICLPNSLHAPMSIAALKAGLHVFCEKPLADTVEACEQVVEAVAHAPGKFMICFNRRYRLDLQWMKNVLHEGKLGRVYQVKAGWIREAGIPGGWFADKVASGGGPLIDLGVHMLDAVMWLLDYPEPLTVSGDVQANFGPRNLKRFRNWRSNTPMPDYTVEDSATAFIRLKGGISFTFETSWASHARPYQDDFYITLYGTEGTVELYVQNYANENTLTLYTEVGGVPTMSRPAVKGEGHDHGYAVAEFIRCVRQDAPPTAPAEEGLVVMQLIDAIYRSAAERREVVLAST